jgi:hypothetical protein
MNTTLEKQLNVSPIYYIQFKDLSNEQKIIWFGQGLQMFWFNGYM